MSDQHVTRRQAIKIAGRASATLIALPPLIHLVAGAQTAIAESSCARLTPELTEGPYWVNTMLRRSDVRANSPNGGGAQAGVPLDLYINVVDTTSGCRPLNGVAVDIWHANAHGLYSDESSQAAGGGTSSAAGDTIADNWLRGYQITGKDRGLRHSAGARPGELPDDLARLVHAAARSTSTCGCASCRAAGATIAGYTTQIFFSDADNDRVLTGAAPYNTRSPQNGSDDRRERHAS